MKRLFLLIVAIIVTHTVVCAETWTVAGQSAIVNGAEWSPENTANDMTTEDGTTYYLAVMAKNINSGSYGFKVCKDHGWSEAYPSDNWILNIDTDDTYTLVYTFNKNNKNINVIQWKSTDTWTVAGSPQALGSNWDLNDANNVMTTEDGVHFTMARSNVALEANTTYEYKIVKNHSWNNENYGDNGNNATFGVNQSGNYNVTFHFNIITHTTSVTTELIPQFDTWTIVGTSAILHGDDYHKWDVSNTDNDMTTNDGTNYYLKIEGKNLHANTVYEYKAVKNHDWEAGSYPASGQDNNQNFTLTQDGTYTIEYYLCIDNDTTLSVVATRTDALSPQMFLKHPWGSDRDEDWTWKELTFNAASGLYFLTGKYGGDAMGVDYNSSPNDVGKTFVANADIEKRGAPVQGDDCVFYYHPRTNRIAIVKGTVTAINDINADATIVGIYNVHGQHLQELSQGINIVRMSNGTTLKVRK